MHESLTICGHCCKQTVKRVKINYTARKLIGDAIVEFNVPDCPVGKCSNPVCNSQWFDWESCQAIDKEFLLIVAEILEMEASKIRGGLRSR